MEIKANGFAFLFIVFNGANMEPKLIINLYNGQLDYQFISKSPKVHLKRKDIAAIELMRSRVHPEISEAEKSINNMLKERTKFNKEFLTTRIVHFVQGLKSVVPLLKEALVTFSLADLKYLDQTQLTKGQISFVVINSSLSQRMLQVLLQNLAQRGNARG